MIFALPAPNIYEKQGRVAGHRHTPTARASLQALKGLVPRLKELKVGTVICAELDEATGRWLARRLNVPYRPLSSLNRFNAGKSHGVKYHDWAALLDTMEVMWTDKPDVPVKGGDSKTSFNKRMASARATLSKPLPPEHPPRPGQAQVLVVAPRQVIGALLQTDPTPLQPYRLYESAIPDITESQR